MVVPTCRSTNKPETTEYDFSNVSYTLRIAAFLPSNQERPMSSALVVLDRDLT